MELGKVSQYEHIPKRCPLCDRGLYLNYNTRMTIIYDCHTRYSFVKSEGKDFYTLNVSKKCTEIAIKNKHKEYKTLIRLLNFFKDQYEMQNK